MDNVKPEVIAYFNDVLARHEERVVVLTGRTNYARFGFELSGADFARTHQIEGKNIDEIVDSCIKHILAAGMAKSITYSPAPLPKPEGSIKFVVSGCIHLSKEARLKQDGVTPFICPLGNILSAVMLEKANFDMGSVGNRSPDAINLEKQECTLSGMLCESIDKALESIQ